MSMLEKYACLYGEVTFTKEEREEIADFVAGLVKFAHISNEAEWKTLVGRHFDYVQNSTFEKIAHYCEYLSVIEGETDPRIRRILDGDGIDKEAQGPGHIGGAPAARSGIMSLISSGLLPAIGAAAVGVPLLMGGLESLGRTRKLKQSLQKIMRDHPELRNDANAGRYFQAISDFAPSVASNPLLAGNVMKQLHQIGPAALTPAMIKDLLGVQETANKMKRGPQDIKDLGQSIIEMSKATSTAQPRGG